MFSTLGYYICIPFAWILRAFYNLTGSYGWALILFTLIVKLVLLPFQLKSKKSMIRMNKFQPKMKEIQEKYANNQQKMNEELQLLYAQEGINPMSGCLWSLLPFPIIIALYSIIRQPLSRFMLLSSETVEKVREIATGLGYVMTETKGRASFYEEIQLAQFVNDHFGSFSGINGLIRMDYNFLGLDLTVMPQDVFKEFFTGGWAVIGLVLIPVISAALSFFQSKVAMAGNGQQDANDAAARSSKSMMLMMPLMSLWIGFTLPAALGVYWIANSAFQIVQDVILNKYFSTRMEQEETEKERQKREARVAKMMAAREQQRAYQEAASKARGGGKPAKKPQSEKSESKKGSSTNEAGRIGDRPYARGRSYSPDHYGE
ncbi:MAG: membrane protein insertase YidC [Ruminococcaceae bacterium]|jgi:YidC/Oxa1 family membrane protein insertase|nr:membrane protein insertase YidC [Oscillospiraceae bacterium]